MGSPRDINTTIQLQRIWLNAYVSGKVEVPFKNHIEGYTIYQLLHNYRKYVRQYKLNPHHDKEWKRIHSCRLAKLRVRDTKITIRRCIPLELKQKEKVDRFHNPLTSLKLPNNRTEICMNT
jgi:hypothetical protein